MSFGTSAPNREPYFPTAAQLSHTGSEADTTNSDPFDPDYWTWDEAEKIIIILIKLPAKNCGMKHHLKFDLEKQGYHSSSCKSTS